MHEPLYEKRDIKTLLPAADNPRTHERFQVEQIADSIKKFGFNNPVLVDEKGGIIAGHGRVLAAKQIGIHEIPVIVLSHLKPHEKKAYRIADNKIALNSGWDIELLYQQLEELKGFEIDTSLVGFNLEELERLKNDADELRLTNMSIDENATSLNGANEPETTESGAIAGEVVGDLLPFSVMLLPDHRAKIFEAVSKAKTLYGVENSGIALYRLCKEWSDGQSVQPLHVDKRRGRRVKSPITEPS